MINRVTILTALFLLPLAAAAGSDGALEFFRIFFYLRNFGYGVLIVNAILLLVYFFKRKKSHALLIFVLGLFTFFIGLFLELNIDEFDSVLIRLFMFFGALNLILPIVRRPVT